MGQLGTRCCLSRKSWSPFPPLFPSSQPHGHGRWVGSRESSRVFWPCHSFPAFHFLSPCLHLVIFWFPSHSHLCRHKASLAPSTPRPQAPWRHYPIPTPHCFLLKPFSLPSGPSQTPTSLSPALPTGLLGGPQGSTDLSLAPCSRDKQSFFSFLVLNTENVKVCLVLSS